MILFNRLLPVLVALSSWNVVTVVVTNAQNTLLTFDEIIAADANLTLFQSALKVANITLSDSFYNDTAVTIFAPTNTAFTAVSDLLTKLADVQYIAHLDDLLFTQIVGGVILSTDLVNEQTIDTVTIEQIKVTIQGGTVTLSTIDSNATVVAVDVRSSEGVLHKIDGVLLPSFLSATLFDVLESTIFIDLTQSVEGFSILQELLVFTGLAASIGPDVTATIFAPSDDAFNKLPDGALDYYRNNKAISTILLSGHVIAPSIIPTQNMISGDLPFMTPAGTTLTVEISEVNGSALYKINNASITIPNILASNGIVHALDSVLNVPGTEFLPPAQNTSLTFDEIIAADSNLTTLNTALTIAKVNLSDSFDNATIFAPTNAAFAVYSDLITKYGGEQYIAHLQNLLLMHVVMDTELLRSNLTNRQTVTVANSESITVMIEGSTVTLSTVNSNATIVAADILSSDGVLHQINGVLVPSFLSTSLQDLAQTVDGFTILRELLVFTDLTASLGPNLTATVFAPSDAAFAELPNGALEYYRQNKDIAMTLLSGHVISPQIIPTQNMVNGTLPFVTAAGTNLTVMILEVDGMTIYKIDNATITNDNVLASNGIIHGLDSVLIVPGAEYPPPTTATLAPIATPPATAPTAVRPPTNTSASSTAISTTMLVVAMLTSLFGWFLMV